MGSKRKTVKNERRKTMDYVLNIIFLTALLYSPIWIIRTAKKNTEEINNYGIIAQKRIRMSFTPKRPNWPEENVTGWEDSITYAYNIKKGR